MIDGVDTYRDLYRHRAVNTAPVIQLYSSMVYLTMLLLPQTM
jgi:hypothetical protein